MNRPGATNGIDLGHIARQQWPKMPILLTSGYLLPVELGRYGPSQRPHEQPETPKSVASAASEPRIAGGPTLRL